MNKIIKQWLFCVFMGVMESIAIIPFFILGWTGYGFFITGITMLFGFWLRFILEKNIWGKGGV